MDPNRPLTEQRNARAPLNEETVKGWVTEAVAEALGTAGQGSADDSEAAQPTDEEQVGQAILKGIEAARTPWYTYEVTDDAA